MSIRKQKNTTLKPYAQKLRREMTDEEKHLWYDFFKLLPLTVHRQKIIGHYIADFYISSAKLVVELDGIQHYTEEGKQYDRRRDKYMSDLGIKVLRYPNIDTKEMFVGVCRDIVKNINARSKYNIRLWEV